MGAGTRVEVGALELWQDVALGLQVLGAKRDDLNRLTCSSSERASATPRCSVGIFFGMPFLSSAVLPLGLVGGF
jgi:hypothetical protein